MEKTYIEQEIKDWFEFMLNRYQNCPYHDHLRHVYDSMFDPFWKRDNLKTFLEKPVDKKKEV